MKKVLFLLLFTLMFPFISVSKENEQFINEFGFVLPDENGNVDVGKIFFGRLDYTRQPKQHLTKGDSVRMSDGHHAGKKIKYLGKENDQLIFEEIKTFNAVSFGGGVTENSKKLIIKPYTFEQFVTVGDEQEIAEELLLDTEFYLQEPIYANWLKNWLLKVGLEKKDAEGNTFLLNATDEDTIQFLLDLGADINAINNKGENILMRQMTRWVLDPKMLRFLLGKGIDKNYRNHEGKTIRDMILEKSKIREYDKVNLEILIGKENCSGVYDETTQRCLDCSSPEIVREHFSTDSAKKLCAMCDNRYYLSGRCHLNIQTKECHKKEGYWMSYFHTGDEDSCNPCEEGDLRMTTYDECKRCSNHIAEPYPHISIYPDYDDVNTCYSCSSEQLWELQYYSKETLQKYCSDWETILKKIEKYKQEREAKLSLRSN